MLVDVFLVLVGVIIVAIDAIMVAVDTVRTVLALRIFRMLLFQLRPRHVSKRQVLAAAYVLGYFEEGVLGLVQALEDVLDDLVRVVKVVSLASHSLEKTQT